MPPKRSTAEMRKLLPKPKRIVKRPKGTAERIEKEAKEKKALKKAFKKAFREQKGKKEVSKMSYKEVVANDPERFIDRARENAEEGIAYSGIEWIKGITASENRFYQNNQYRFSELSQAKQDKIEAIQDKVLEGMGPSLERELSKVFKLWKEKNKDKKLSLKDAQDSFESFYF